MEVRKPNKLIGDNETFLSKEFEKKKEDFSGITEVASCNKFVLD